MIMNKKTIIKEIIDNYRFSTHKKKFPNSCPCYTSKKCHDLPDEELICFFCLCPEYDKGTQEGSCRINSKKGKWFYHDKLEKGKIWDCSDCEIPHTEANVRKILERSFK